MPTVRHTLFVFLSIAAVAAATGAQARQGAVHVRGANGAATAVAGPNGVAGRAHGTTTTSDGTVVHGSTAGFAGVNGSRGARASTTSVSPDGSVTRTGQAVRAAAPAAAAASRALPMAA